ncbi:MAG: DUF4349 domain-containing protein [Syntrophomonadaceae bacterium]|nr:DUF4349 domain-containing protein [Syntrophomonadaceae bacterium]
MPNIKPFPGRPVSLLNNLILLMLLCLLLGIFSGGGSSSKDASTLEIAAPSGQFNLPADGAIRTPVSAERKMIQNADLTLQVKDVPATVDRISDLTVKTGGYLVNSRQYRYEDKISASLSVKVPADKLTATVETISGYGELSDKTISTEDVTEEYYDAQARLTVLEAKEVRLLALLEKANTITDMVSVEKELGTVRSNIEVIKGRLKYLKNATSFSTVNITLEQALPGSLKAPQGTLGKAWQGLITSLNTLIDFGSGLIVFLVVILPWVALIGLFFYLIRYLYRRRKNNKSVE